MGNLIAILPSDLINKIAAGEVIERPASVVKELIENSIDAGAKAIDIRIEHGGKKLIEVSDDGCGMPAQDARLALERHATSKISAFEDLESVTTLGFRGEALPSIASVSHLTLLSSPGAGGAATEVDCFPGEEPVVRPTARARGTTISVRNLFANVPARRKFLKSTDGEFRAIIVVLWSYALPNPAIALRVEHNGRVVIDLPAVATHRERVIQVLGDEIAADLSVVEFGIEETLARGFVTKTSPYGSRRNQYFFVNGRLVRDKVLTHAASRATGAFQSSQHPGVVLFLEVDPQFVDVNVHPAKTEVRFRDSGKVHVVVEEGIRRALGVPEEGGGLLRPGEGAADTIRNGDGASPTRPWTDVGQNELLRVELPTGRAFEPGVAPLFRSRPVIQPPSEERPTDLGDLRGRVIGQYRSSYILIDTPDGLRLIDQHVAHERVLCDRLEAAASAEKVDSQRLLQPFVYEAGAASAGGIESHLDELRAVGFEIEPFSGHSFAISSIPSIVGRQPLPAFFRKLLDESLEGGGSHLQSIRERIIASVACQAAIKVHYPLTGEAMSKLVADLLATSNPFACPHGRPIIVDIRHSDIERHFFRR